jgi:hypothetical protein
MGYLSTCKEVDWGAYSTQNPAGWHMKAFHFFMMPAQHYRAAMNPIHTKQ